MREHAVEEAAKLLAGDRRRRIWKKIVGILACVVVFCTTYALILPVITLEKTPSCGKTEHTHTEACYTPVSHAAETVPICTPESLGLHAHTAGCYNGDGELMCGYTDFFVHTHDASCYDADGVLWCPLPEIEAHTHTDSCWAVPETAAHTHTDECYALEQGELICAIPEGEGAHTHSEACYTAEQVMTCSVPESEGHRHDETCYAQNRVLICGLSEEPAPAGETAEPELVCGREEIILHTHDASCFDESGALICGQVQVLEHRHTAACFQTVEEPTETLELTCGMEEHVHTEDCYPRRQESMSNALYACGMEEHTHSDACYSESGELLCTMAEHTHTDACRLLFADSGMEELGMTAVLSANGASAEAPAADGAPAAEPLKLPVSNVKGTGTTYDPDTDSYTTDLKINFQFTNRSAQAGVDYVFTYPKEVLVPDGLIGQVKNLTDAGGTYAGTYTFVRNADGTTSVKVNLAPEYVNSAGDTIDGFVEFSGTLKTQTDKDGGIKITVGEDNLSIDIPPEEIKYPSDETDRYNISVSKSGTFVETDGSKLVYTVYVRSKKGTPDSIDFNDVLNASGLDLGTPMVKVEKGTYRYYNKDDKRDNNDWQEIIPTPSYTYENGKISMTLPGLEPGVQESDYTKCNYYKITYNYDITKLPNLNVSPHNDVTVTSKDEEKGQTVTDKGESTVHINKAYTVSKSGKYADGFITWTITVNDNKLDIAGAQITDSMLDSLAQGTDLKIEPDSGYEYITDAGGKTTGIKFTALEGGTTNTNKYTITYKTPAQPKWEAQNVTNTADFTTPGGEHHTATGTVYIPGSDAGNVDKIHGEMVKNSDGTAIIPWTVTVDVPAAGLPAGTTIWDDVRDPDNLGWYNSAAHWITLEQINEIWQSMRWEKDNSLISNAHEITKLKVEWKEYGSLAAAQREGITKFTAFEITFPNGLIPPNEEAQKLTFTYYTTVDLTRVQIGKTDYVNHIKVGNKEDTDTYPYHKGGVVKTDGNGGTGTTQITTPGDTMTWKVQVYMDGQTHQTLTLTDTLPDGVTLEDISVTGDASIEVFVDASGQITGESTDHKVAVNGTYSGKVIQLNLNGNIGSTAHYEFTFSCKADPSIMDGASHPLTNKVTVTTDKENLGSSEQTQDWTHKTAETVTKVLDKNGTWDNDNRRLDYSIVINPEGKDLVEGTDVLTLTDELTYTNKAWLSYTADVTVTLLPSTVMLYQAVPDNNGGWIKGTAVKDWKWTYTAGPKPNNGNENVNTITATNVPDSTPLIMEYAYSVSTTIKEGDKYDLVIDNTARLDGTGYQDTGNVPSKKWEDQTSSGGVSTDKTYTFYKVEAGDYNRMLAGAVFNVYRYNAETQGYVETGITYTTDQDGTFHIQWQENASDPQYAKNTLYMVKETQAPENYELPDQVPQYYFYFSDENDTAHTLPETLPDGAVDLSETGRTVYAENVRNATDIVVKKEWRDADGNVVPHNADTSITVNVYQKKSTTASGEGSGTGDGETKLTGEIRSGDSANSNPWLEFDDIYPVGTELAFTFTRKEDVDPTTKLDLTFNGVALEAEKVERIEIKESEWYSHYYQAATYSIVLQPGTNTLSGRETSWTTSAWEWSDFTVTAPAPAPDEPEAGAEPAPEAPFRPLTLNKANDWRAELLDLPLSDTDADGNTVYYTYYVEEVAVPNYTPTYTNNGGITSGTITITNTLEKNPGHQLPATGGSGTRPYTIGGLLLTGAGAILLYSKRKRGRGAGKVF